MALGHQTVPAEAFLRPRKPYLKIPHQGVLGQSKHAFLLACIKRDVQTPRDRINLEQECSAGVDGETIADIEALGVEKWVGELARDLKDGTYVPKPVRQVLIPKKQRGKFRPLGIPCLRDRVAQTSAMLVLEPGQSHFIVVESVCALEGVERSISGLPLACRGLMGVCSRTLNGVAGAPPQGWKGLGSDLRNEHHSRFTQL